MAHAELFQLGEQLLGARCIQMLHAAAAIGGDDANFFRVGVEQSRDKWAVAQFEMAQDAHLVGEPPRGIRPVVNLHHPAIEGQVHRRPERVFDFQHKQTTARPRTVGEDAPPLQCFWNFSSEPTARALVGRFHIGASGFAQAEQKITGEFPAGPGRNKNCDPRKPPARAGWNAFLPPAQQFSCGVAFTLLKIEK